MPRRREVKKRQIVPDPKYHDALIAKFINGIMRRGKKSLAESIFYGALDIVKEKTHSDPAKAFRQAMDNVKPLIEVRPRRVGGATYQVPVEVRTERKNALAIRWIITYSKQRPEKTMEEKLSGEIIDAINNRGAAIKKREDTHKMAEANKAFAHYRW
jgi:small subunit ribosomal protein S7